MTSYNVGLDVNREHTAVCILDRNSKRVKRLATSGAAAWCVNHACPKWRELQGDYPAVATRLKYESWKQTLARLLSIRSITYWA